MCFTIDAFQVGRVDSKHNYEVQNIFQIILAHTFP